MASSNISLVRRLMRNLSLVTLSAIALMVGVSYTVRSVSTANSSTTQSSSKFPNPTQDLTRSTIQDKQTLVLAGGCFWGMEAVFEHLKGVSHVESGFSGGDIALRVEQT